MKFSQPIISCLIFASSTIFARRTNMYQIGFISLLEEIAAMGNLNSTTRQQDKAYKKYVKQERKARMQEYLVNREEQRRLFKASEIDRKYNEIRAWEQRQRELEENKRIQQEKRNE